MNDDDLYWRFCSMIPVLVLFVPYTRTSRKKVNKVQQNRKTGGDIIFWRFVSALRLFSIFFLAFFLHCVLFLKTCRIFMIRYCHMTFKALSLYFMMN